MSSSMFGKNINKNKTKYPNDYTKINYKYLMFLK